MWRILTQCLSLEKVSTTKLYTISLNCWPIWVAIVLPLYLKLLSRRQRIATQKNRQDHQYPSFSARNTISATVCQLNTASLEVESLSHVSTISLKILRVLYVDYVTQKSSTHRALIDQHQTRNTLEIAKNVRLAVRQPWQGQHLDRPCFPIRIGIC